MFTTGRQNYTRKGEGGDDKPIIKGGCLEKSLSQESGDHVNFLIKKKKTKLKQKWLAFPILPTASWYCYGRLEHQFDLSFGSSTGPTPGRPERKGWQKDKESGSQGEPLDQWVSVSLTRTHRSRRSIGFLCLVRFGIFGGSAAALGDYARCQRSRRPCFAKRLFYFELVTPEVLPLSRHSSRSFLPLEA